MNILVTGANGQLGTEMRLTASPAHHYIYTDVNAPEGVPTEKLDITDAGAINALVDREHIDCIVNCAAYTNVDRAETDTDLCRLLNATAPAHLAAAMARTGGMLIHISTDYVFGAEPYNTPCDEARTGTPTGVYGATKLEGERAIAATGCRHIIIRTAWLYSEYGKNFLKTMLNLTATKPEVNVVFDQAGTPTYALDLARVINRIIDAHATGERPVCGGEIYNYTNEGVCSWYDFAHCIATLAGHSGCRVKPCHSSEFPSPVKRPAYSVLDKSKIKQDYGIEIPHWTESLRACIDNMKTL